MYDLNQLQKEKTDLQERVSQLKKGYLKLLIKPIIILPIFTVVIPFLPLRGHRRNSVKIMSTEESILLVGTVFSLAFLWGVIVKFKEYKAEKFDIESEIELIDFRIDRLKSTPK